MSATSPYYQYAFLSAFTTIPNFQQPTLFFENEIESLFLGYRNALDAMKDERTPKGATQNTGSTADPILYAPVSYCLLGDFDLAVFSLIDDFSFATKKFKPSARSVSFKYQVNTGIIPLVEAYENRKNLDSFMHQRIPGFFSREQVYPFTGIASLKLNNAMIAGTGKELIELINFYLICYLDHALDSLSKDGVNMFYILNENLGWNEVNIYFFGNSMRIMQDLLFGLRSKRLRDIYDFLEHLPAGKGYDISKIQNEIFPLFGQLKNESLLADMLAGSEANYLESHPVIASSITFGYHVSLPHLITDSSALASACKFEQTDIDFLMAECAVPSISIGWKVKPGHEFAANKVIQTILPRTGELLYDQVKTGKYPFSYPAQPICLSEYLTLGKVADSGLRSELCRHVIKFRSRISWEHKQDYASFDERLHFNYDLSPYQIGASVIEEIQQKLRIYPIPYTFKGQIENLIINFNDAMGDPLMYNYFIGLKRALLNFLKEHFKIEIPGEEAKEIEKAKKGLLSIRGKEQETLDARPSPLVAIEVKSMDVDNLSVFIQAWNKAYWNRYFHSYYFTEINDFNIEHHGGIQQILLTYDVIYKLISERIYGANCKRPFVNVQVGPIITSTQYYNTINFTHLFRPAIYACECVHEAANHILPFLVKELGRKEFSFLLNPRNDVVDPEKFEELLKMEQELKDDLGPRDDYEVRYINERFGLNSTRHMVADYITFKLGYSTHPDKNTEEIQLFYQTHWFLFLLRTDLYAREINAQGAWFFREDEFKALFIRFNLMFYLCMGYRSAAQLEELNEVCPSIELKPVWESEKSRLIQFVIRLGGALRTALSKRLISTDVNKPAGNGIDHLLDTINEEIIEKGWENLSDSGKSWYTEAISRNRAIISRFHQLFSPSTSPPKYNIIKRLSKSKIGEEGNSSVTGNIGFYQDHSERVIYLDPKGNLFSTSGEIRKEVYQANIHYIRDMWSLSMKIMREEYRRG